VIKFTDITNFCALVTIGTVMYSKYTVSQCIVIPDHVFDYHTLANSANLTFSTVHKIINHSR
jgi:hypothetical protein